MAVTVYDRNEASWEYNQAVKVQQNPDSLALLNEHGEVVGLFNQAAWTHVVVDGKPDK